MSKTAELTANLTRFMGLLRRSGLPVGPGDSALAYRALAALPLEDRGSVYLGLRSVLVKRRDDYPIFDAAFRAFFDGDLPPETEEQRQQAGEAPEDADLLGESREGGASSQEVLLEQDVAGLNPEDRAEAVRLAALIARRLALKLSRRRRRSQKGRRIDLRATAHRSARWAGLPLELMRTRRRRRPANLVLLLDVSGSMEHYSRMLFHFIHALQRSLPRTRTFCFATRLAHVSAELRGQGYDAAIGRAQPKVQGWGGGTRIGTSLTEFVSEWAPALLGPRSVVIILSDGLDTGDPELIAQAMAQIRRRAGRVLWLNPLAGDPRYQPLARGMATALPYVDLLAPGHSLGSLLTLEKELARLEP